MVFTTIKHGHKKKNKVSAEYSAWCTMNYRCHNENCKDWHRYGGRGIKVFEEWRKNFISFLDYIGLKPSKEFSLDRIDNNGNYEPGNVRWVDRKVQNNNRRRSSRQSRYKEKCLVCEEEFTTIPSVSGKFCNPNCWYDYYRMRGTKEKIKNV